MNYTINVRNNVLNIATKITKIYMIFLISYPSYIKFALKIISYTLKALILLYF